MLLIKKLLLLNILGGGIITPIVYYTQQEEPIERLELKNTLKEWGKLFSKISGNNDFQKLSKLFSRNLTTFSKSVVVNSVKQLLMQWAIQIWENQDLFFPISQRLNKFFFYYHIHHWKMHNEVEELSWELIKNFFIDFFFKEKGWFFLSKFGDFSSFVLSEWKKREKPMQVYKWTIKYSNAGDDKQNSFGDTTLYNKAELENIKIKAPHLFPEIQGSEEYSSFLSKFQHKEEIELSKFKKTLFTISDLTKLQDGYELGALIHLFSQEQAETSKQTNGVGMINELILSSQDSNLDVSKNPLYLFLNAETIPKKKQEDCLSINKSLFNEKIQGSIKGDSLCLHNVKWLKKANGGEGNGKKILVSREKQGISFYYLPKNSNGKDSEKKHIDEQDPEVIKRVEIFVKEHFETVFLKYLASKKTENGSTLNYTSFDLTLVNSAPEKKEKLVFSDFFKKHQSIINAAAEYLEALYFAQSCKTLQTILLNVYEFTPEEIEMKQEENITLPVSAGLFSPLKYKRNNGDSEVKEITLPTNNEEINDFKKYGLFEDLLTFLSNNSETNKQGVSTNLEAKAQELKKQLNNHTNLFKASSLEDLYLRDLFYRAQLDDISKNHLKSVNSIFTLKLEELLFPKQDVSSGEQQNQFSSLLTKYIESLKNKESDQKGNGGNWKDLIDESFFLEPFLNSSLEKKIFYGSFSREEKDQGENGSIDKKKITTKAKNNWILDHFYFSDSAYESSSKEYQELLSFLYTLKWLTMNNYSNMAKLMNHILGKNKNKNAYLLWTKEITEKEKEKLEKKEEDSNSEAPQSPKTELHELFKESLSTDITNPLLSGEFKSGSKKQPFKISDYPRSSIHAVKGYKNGAGSEIKLSGFQGLITESFSSRKISPQLKNYIFRDFLSSNSFKNKNYSAEVEKTKQDENSEAGLIEGAFFSDNEKRELKNNQELLTLLNKTNTKAKLLKYLDSSINSLNIALDNKDQDINYLTLKELKDALNKGLNSENQLVSVGDNDKIKHLYKLFNRFSGYLYFSNSNEKTPYVFTEADEKDSSEKKYFINFLYQINQFDFEEKGIKDLKENLSEETINTLITMLASNKSIREWVYESEMIKQLNLT